jgi:hypothetical protein
MHGNAKKGLDDNLPFQAMVGFFLQIYFRGVFQHLLILNEHGFHITIQAPEHVIEVGLDMVTLLTHTSHAL